MAQEKKQLSWEEWQKKANAEYVKGQRGPQEMIRDWGYPEGMSPDTHKIEFDKSKVRARPRANRRERQARANANRSQSLKIQTVGKNVYRKGVVAPKGSDLQEHHKRIASVYDQFFKGLNGKEQKELARWFVEEGSSLGNVAENLDAIFQSQHSDIHKWAVDNFIEPKSGKLLLDFEKFPLNERYPRIIQFLKYIQPAVDEQLQKIKTSTQDKLALDDSVEYRAGLPMPSRQFIKQNALGAGAGAVTGAITPESAYAAGKGDWRTAAVEGVKAAATGAITGGAIQAGLTNLMPRVAAGLASGPVMPLVAGVGTALTLQDAAQAYKAGQSGRSIPLQKKVEQAQQNKRRQQDVAQFRAAMPGVASKNRMQADLSGRLSPQQIESFRAGGGNAAMMRDGLSVQQVIERGSSLRLKKIVNSTIRDQV